MLIYAAAGLSLLLAVIYVFPPKIRVVKLDSKWESLVWTIRLLLWKHRFPESYQDFRGSKGYTQTDRLHSLHTWEFVFPFFASRGYTLFKKSSESCDSFRSPHYPAPAKHRTHPFSRVLPTKKSPDAVWLSPSIWFARDKLGRDVVIKLISDILTASNELSVLKRLNQPEIRSDPRNHTIHVLEFLTFDNLVFVVMPRWDNGFAADFGTVSELMEISKTFLETFVFLHGNKIVHHDFLGQNTGMNVNMKITDLFQTQGLRDPCEVQYALYDFGNSIAYPEDTVIEDVVATRFLNYHLHSLPKVKGPYNPFKADVAFLGSELQLQVRHIENIVPELGPFFEQMTNMMDESQFTAAQALARFLEIYNGLTPAQLQEPVTTRYWENGEITKKRVWKA